MICSVLIPSRKRPEGLRKAIESLYTSVSDPNNIEILVRLDDDAVMDSVPAGCDLPFDSVIGPRGRGYRDLNKMYAQLASIAKGPYLWIFNDDAYVRLAKAGDDFPVRRHEGEPDRKFESDATPFDIQLQQIKSRVLDTQYIIQPHEPKYGLVESGCFPLFTKECAAAWRLGWVDPIDTNAHKNVIDMGGKTYYLPGVLVYHERASDEEQYRHQNT